jgi:lipopolysaccharide export system ATP-binding protein
MFRSAKPAPASGAADWPAPARDAHAFPDPYAQDAAVQYRPAPSPPPPPLGAQAGGGSVAIASSGNDRLSVNQLSKTYKSRRVIEDVSLEVYRGEAVALLGPNGAGKTTLFYMITGLVRPDSGTIMLDDYDVTSLPMYRRARLGIGYLPQEPSIFRGMSVEDNIRAVLEISQKDKRKRAEELEALLNEFDIAKRRKTPAIALSGGERRRCEIARALAGHPSFILLDEPFAGIDPIAVGDIQVLVRHLTRRGIGVLITDHNVRETLGLIDRAYIVHSGHILTEGTPDEIVANPDVRRSYLGEDFRL